MSEKVRPKILLLDNDPDFLFLIDRLLCKRYTVVKVSNISEAKEQLKRHFFNLIITDIRLEDNDNARDRGGLNFIKDPEIAHVPKLVITAYASFEYAREALGNAVDIVDKADTDKLIAVVNAIFEKMNVNWDLRIEFGYGTDPLQVARHIYPEMSHATLDEASRELEFLFRGMFPSATALRLERVIWAVPTRVALIAHVFQEGSQPFSRILVCGKHETMDHDRENYERAANVANPYNTHAGPEDFRTLHLRGYTYQTVGGDLSELINLSIQYHMGSPQTTAAIIDRLFDQTLAYWRRAVRLEEVERKGSMKAWAEYRFYIEQKMSLEKSFEWAIQECIKGDLPVQDDGDMLIFGEGRETHALPHPRQVFESELDYVVPFAYSGGGVLMSHILTDGIKETWLTNFWDAVPAPAFRDFFDIEASIRFDWGTLDDVNDVMRLETALLSDTLIPNKEDPLYKPLYLIRHLRGLKHAPDVEPKVKALGFFYHAFGRFRKPLRAHYLPKELVQIFHCLYCCALQAEILLKEEDEIPDGPAPINENPNGKGKDQPCKGVVIVVIEAKKTVLVNENEVVLSPNRFKLFKHLYQNAGQVVSRQVLGELVWEGFQAEKPADINRLNPLMSRIREQIEEGLDCSLIETVRGKGYRFVPQGIVK